MIGNFCFRKQKKEVENFSLKTVSSAYTIDIRCTQTEAIALNLSRLIQFRSVKKMHRSSNVWHSRSNYPPFNEGLFMYYHGVRKIQKKYHSTSLHVVQQRSIRMSTKTKTRTIHYNSYR